MSKAFLPTILEQKEKEVAQLVMEDLQPLRQTYRLYEFLKSNQNKLQIISEVKKASPSMGDINLDVDIVAQAGDRVITGKYTGTEVKIDGEEYTIVRQSDVLAVVE